MNKNIKKITLVELLVIIASIFLLSSSGYGAKDNTYVILSDYSSLSAALTSIGSSQKTLLIDKDDTITVDVTAPANVSLKFCRPYKLTINSGIELTIQSSVIAPPVQIFSGAGDVLFSDSVQKEIYPHWFYDGSNDWTDAIQDAIDSSNGVEVVFPRQEYLVKGTITLRAYTTLRGVGGQKMTDSQSSPSIHHDPTTSGAHLFIVETPASLFTNSIKVKNLAFYGQDDGSEGDCLHLTKLGFSTFSNLYISDFKNAINICNGIDNRIVDCFVNYSDEAALRIRGDGDVTTTTTIDKCYLRTSSWGVIIEDNGSLQTSFIDTIIEANSDGGVNIYKGNTGVSFRGCYTEMNPPTSIAAPIIRIGVNGTSTNPTEVSITGGDYSGGNNGSIHADSSFIDIDAGIVNIFGCTVKRVGKLIKTTSNTERVNIFGIQYQQIADIFGSVAKMSRVCGERPSYGGGPVQMHTSMLTLNSGQSSATWRVSAQYNQTNSDLILEANGSEKLRIDANGQVGIGINHPKATLHSTGSTILGAPTSAIINPSTSMGNSQINVYLDESGGNLKFKIRKSNGDFKTVTIPFD